MIFVFFYTLFFCKSGFCSRDLSSEASSTVEKIFTNRVKILEITIKSDTLIYTETDQDGLLRTTSEAITPNTSFTCIFKEEIQQLIISPDNTNMIIPPIDIQIKEPNDIMHFINNEDVINNVIFNEGKYSSIKAHFRNPLNFIINNNYFYTQYNIYAAKKSIVTLNFMNLDINKSEEHYPDVITSVASSFNISTQALLKKQPTLNNYGSILLNIDESVLNIKSSLFKKTPSLSTYSNIEIAPSFFISVNNENNSIKYILDKP